MSTSSTAPSTPTRLWLTGSFTFLLMITGTCLFYSSCTRVDVGHVGIRVRLAGSERGVEDAPIVTGWVVYNPLTEAIIEFPTNVQNVVWTASPNEGSPIDESITFASSEGVSVNADVGLAFHIDPSTAPHLYARFRESDVQVLAHGYVRNVVREALSEGASQMTVQDIYGVRKTELLHAAQAAIEERLEGEGFVIDQLSFVSALRLPPNVVESINEAMAATQNAIQAENRVRQVRAEAEQTIAQARGDAEAARQRAQGEADALLIRARGGPGQRDHPPLDLSGGDRLPAAPALGRAAPRRRRRDRRRADADPGVEPVPARPGGRTTRTASRAARFGASSHDARAGAGRRRSDSAGAVIEAEVRSGHRSCYA